jgi:ABC-type proline/glycine betaine transport system ATPase subunit
MTIILVTHEQDISRFTRRIILFKDGQVIQDGLSEPARISQPAGLSQIEERPG